eukprot:3134363-Pyramimonas_sp.AAC.1
MRQRQLEPARWHLLQECPGQARRGSRGGSGPSWDRWQSLFQNGAFDDIHGLILPVNAAGRIASRCRRRALRA